MNEITWSFMVSRIMAPKDVQIVISATCAYVTWQSQPECSTWMYLGQSTCQPSLQATYGCLLFCKDWTDGSGSVRGHREAWKSPSGYTWVSAGPIVLSAFISPAGR